MILKSEGYEVVITREVVRRGIAASISGVTVWRWLISDAIRPWSYRSWTWPRDPDDFKDLNEVERQLMEFQLYYEQIAKPSKREFTKDELKRILAKITLYDLTRTSRNQTGKKTKKF